VRLVCPSLSIGGNGLRLGKEADLEAQNCRATTKAY